MKMIAPNIPTAVKKATVTEIANWLVLKSSKGTTGFRAQRISTTKNPDSMTAAPTSRASTSGEVQEWSWVIERPTSRGMTPAASIAAPAKSISLHETFDRTYGSAASVTATARIPTGTLT